MYRYPESCNGHRNATSPSAVTASRLSSVCYSRTMVDWQAKWHLLLLLICLSTAPGRGIQLTAFLSQNGLHGTVVWEDAAVPGSVSVRLDLQDAVEASEWSWSVRTLPVTYSLLDNRCSQARLGDRMLDLDALFGKVSLPANGTDSFLDDTGKLVMTGSAGVWGRTLYFEATDGSERIACATITVTGEADEKVAEARFAAGGISGSIFLRWVGSHDRDSTDTLVHADLHAVSRSEDSSSLPSEHGWKIYATDVLDSELDKARANCDFLQLVFNPVYSNATRPVGDLDVRLGKLKVARMGQRHVTVYHDSGLAAVTVDLLDGQRSLYFVVFDEKHSDSFMACARITALKPVTLKSLIQSQGVKGDVTLTQRSPFDPTWLTFNLTSTQTHLSVSSYKIHQLPPPSSRDRDKARNKCGETGNVYNPNNIPPDLGSGSQDTYPLGDLSGKHNVYQKEQSLSELNARLWDVYLPLFGQFSVAHRSMVFYQHDTRLGESVPWICNVFSRYDPLGFKVPITTASIVFRYPIVGRILLRQAQDDPTSDTTVLVESLIHADGTSQNNTAEHRWKVHVEPPGTDFYNWTGRCLSSGDVFNPYKVSSDNATDDPLCSRHRPGLCALGDLSGRHGTLDIAGRRREKALSRRLLTDSQLPLSGPASVLGRSFVLYGEHGPLARGERLACSKITVVYRRKAVAHNWFGNGNLTPVNGAIEFLQLSEYDVTDVEVDLQGLDDNKGYHIHVAPVDEQLEFPCEDSTLYGHWNPANVSRSLSPGPALGTADQYEVGDLSGKYGTLAGLRGLNADYNDTNLPLFGPDSVLGRSVVIHKRDKDSRWACASVERGYAPSEARERRAIASFHNPLGYAFGFVRMTQLVYNDGSMSETVIEVKLRHPGKNDRNVTRNHNWAIFVNPVGVDATVQFESHRCVAGGYRWNPYYTQLADPLNEDLYREECAPDNPLRCYVGDLSGRLGTIDIGARRQVFSDVNFPLEGRDSAMGKSIVVMTKDRGGNRYACANIEPDHDIIKFANIRKPPRFVMANFMEDVRSVLGIPEWMLTVDSRKTKVLHDGACVQFLLHFKGPVATQLEQDFTRLMNGKKLAAPSLSIHGAVPDPKRKTQVSYRPCGSRTLSSIKGGYENMMSSAGSTFLAGNLVFLAVSVCYFTFV